MAVVLDAITDLATAVDAMCAADPARLADGETVGALHRQLERLSAATTRTAASFDAGRTWEAPRRSGGSKTRCSQPDWAETRERVGSGVTLADLARTPAHRRADALVEMARRAGAVPAGARMPEPLSTCSWATKRSPGASASWPTGPWSLPARLSNGRTGPGWSGVVFDGPDRIKNVGVRRRLFAGATRRAVEVRDRECSTSCATSRRSGARSTTSSHGRPAD